MRIRALSVVVLVVATLGLAGCSSSGADSAAPASASAVASMPVPGAPQRVDAATFAAALATPGITVIDVRRPEEFSAGHIDGAVNFNVEGADFAAQVAALDPTKTYAVYCHSGNRSQVAVAQMSQAGIQHIYELESGISGWQAAGYPVVS